MSQHPPLTGSVEQKMVEEDKEGVEELNFVPSAVSEPRWSLHMCDNRCWGKASSSSKLRIL